MEHLFESQQWLTEDDKEFLKSYLNPENPIKPQELKVWRKTILEATGGRNESLTALGQQLFAAKANGQAETLSQTTLKALEEAEAQLGMIHKEVSYIFNEGHTTVTSDHASQASFDIAQMTSLMDGDRAELVQKVKAIIGSEDFAYPNPENLAEHRDQVYALCKKLADEGLGSWAFPKEYGGENDMEGYFTIMETLSFHDLSMVIKFGVQFGLWGMSIFFLGSEKHHKKYLSEIGTLQLPGCFAMTETNHGSNVKGIETTATYHHGERKFVIHTPHEKACKEYIGNAAVHGQMATVFAKLIIEGTDYGVSAFVVPLRSKEGDLLEGVRIEDCGPKMGLNGVDKSGLIR
jgi:acyl-CoA oxidase